MTRQTASRLGQWMWTTIAVALIAYTVFSVFLIWERSQVDSSVETAAQEITPVAPPKDLNPVEGYGYWKAVIQQDLSSRVSVVCVHGGPFFWYKDRLYPLQRDVYTKAWKICLSRARARTSGGS